MLKVRQDIERYGEGIKGYEGTYCDKFDPVNPDGTEKLKSYVPNSLRVAFPLHHSKKVKNDSRCSDVYTELTKEMERAKSVHEEYEKKCLPMQRLLLSWKRKPE